MHYNCDQVARHPVDGCLFLAASRNAVDDDLRDKSLLRFEVEVARFTRRDGSNPSLPQERL